MAAHGSTKNTATASSNETGSLKQSAVVIGETIRPVLLITKSVSRSAAGPFVRLIYQDVDKTVFYRIVVTNGGNVALTGITLTDSLTDLVATAHAVRPAWLSAAAQAMRRCHGGPNPAVNTATADSAETDPPVMASARVGTHGDVFGVQTGRLAITKVIDGGAG